ncbi:RnpA RNase P protein component [Methylophilaceae bacterium]
MPSYRLIKEAKLIKTDEFSSVFNFRKRIATEYLALHYQTNQLQRPRLGLVVGKKTAKLAVSRNYMRRVLRELFRLKQHEILAADIILRVQKKFEKSDFQLIQLEFNALVVKLNQRLARAEINHDKGHEA